MLPRTGEDHFDIKWWDIQGRRGLNVPLSTKLTWSL